MTANSADSSDPQPGRPPQQQRRRWRPRPETTVLLLAFLCTALAKLLAAHQFQPPSLLAAWTRAAISDVAFFAVITAAFAVAWAVRPGRAVARATLILASLVLLWSFLDAAWLLTTGVQLQFPVILVMLRQPAQFWPLVQSRIQKLPGLLNAVGGVAALAAVAWFLWRLVRPVVAARGRRQHIYRAATAAGVLVASALLQHYLPPTGVASLGLALNFSTHAYALRSAVLGPPQLNDTEYQSRYVPRIGQRQVIPPAADPTQLPNIVLVLMESVSYQASALGDPQRQTMPELARLAGEGVEFVNTRVCVPQTGKAFWTVLSGTTPDIDSDYSEAILVDQPYEGLPSLLRCLGYRSAFFQMADGAFECAPGTFANFTFDWAWFGENLQDPSAKLAFFSADDFRMLDPALAWATQDDQPFLLMLCTSVAHDPCVVPAWFDQPEEDSYEAYVQAVRYTDAFLGELRRRLEQLGIEDDTLLCVLGDHGDSFRPEARRLRWVPYEEVLRIPWIIRWPGRVPAGTRIDWPCHQMDVTPTILSLLGYDITSAGFDGRDALTPADPDRRMYFFSWFEGSPFGCIEGTRKWLYWPRSDKVLAYDLQADPLERSPVDVAGPEKQRIIADLARWQQEAHIVFDPKRSRERFLYEHWWSFTFGRYAWARYVP